MTQTYDESQPVETRAGVSGCRLLFGALAFGLIALALLATCGVIALVVAQDRGVLANLEPPTPTVPPLLVGVTISPVPTRGPTDTPQPTATFTPTATSTPPPTATPTDTPAVTETQPPTNTDIPSTRLPQQVAPTLPPTTVPTQPPASGGSSRGLTADFSVESTAIRPGERVWFNFTIRNPGSAAVPWGIIGAAVELNGQNMPDLFQTSWSGAGTFDPGSPMTWRDAVTLPSAGTYTLHLAVCYSDEATCRTPNGAWEYLGPPATVTVN